MITHSHYFIQFIIIILIIIILIIFIIFIIIIYIIIIITPILIKMDPLLDLLLCKVKIIHQVILLP